MSEYGKKECSQCEGTGILFGCTCDYCVDGEVDRTLEDHEDELDYWAEMNADEERLNK